MDKVSAQEYYRYWHFINKNIMKKEIIKHKQLVETIKNKLEMGKTLIDDPSFSQNEISEQKEIKRSYKEKSLQKKFFTRHAKFLTYLFNENESMINEYHTKTTELMEEVMEFYESGPEGDYLQVCDIFKKNYAHHKMLFDKFKLKRSTDCSIQHHIPISDRGWRQKYDLEQEAIARHRGVGNH